MIDIEKKSEEQQNGNAGTTGIGENIASLRKRNGLTQAQLAEQLGISAQAVSKWESGLSCPDIMTLMPLARLFGVTVDELLSQETISCEEKPRIKLDKEEDQEEDKEEVRKEQNSFTENRGLGDGDRIFCRVNEKISSLKLEMGAAQVFVRPGAEFSLELRGYAPGECKSQVVGGQWRVCDHRGLGVFFGIRSIFFERRAILTVPEDYFFQELIMNIGAGTVTAEGLSSSRCKLNVGAGQMTLMDFHSGDAQVNCGMGDIKLKGSLEGKCKMECGMGSIAADIRPLEDVGYDMSVGLGEIKFGQDGFSGMGGHQRSNADASNFFKIECGMGVVSIRFTKG